MHVVTGGAGFIGSHVVDELLNTKYLERLLVVDNLSRTNGSSSNLRADERMTLKLRDLEYTIPWLEDAKVVYHLAAKVSNIAYNSANQYVMLASNLAIVLNVIRAIVLGRKTVRRVMWVSTACVYPHDAPVPTPEDGTADVCDPEPTNRGYGIAKWVGEQLAIGMGQEYSIATTVVRFFNAVGVRDYYDYESSHVAPALIRRVFELKTGEPLTIWGSGQQTRALVDAKDIAKALVMLEDCRKAHGQIVNIGHAREISMLDLAKLIVDMAYGMGYISSKPEIVCDVARPDGYPRRAADTTKLKRLIGWVPDTRLEVSIQCMLQDYMTRYGQS